MGKRERVRERKRKRGVQQRSERLGRVGPRATPSQRPPRTPMRSPVATAPSTQKRVYEASQHTLVVGDGDFSFSLGLVKHRGSGERVVCTSLDDAATVLHKYPRSRGILEQLSAKGVRVQHGVDATKLGSTLGLPHGHPRLFDRIIFNFPHSGRQRVHINQALLGDFFASCRQFLHPTGEVHVAQKCAPPYSDWRLVDMATAKGLVHTSATLFQPSLFPGYRHQTTNPDHSKFDFADARTFVFVHSHASVRTGREEAQASARKKAKRANEAAPAPAPAVPCVAETRPVAVQGNKEEQSAGNHGPRPPTPGASSPGAAVVKRQGPHVMVLVPSPLSALPRRRCGGLGRWGRVRTAARALWRAARLAQAALSHA